MRIARSTCNLITIWACGTAAGLSFAQPPAIQVPSNVPTQAPPTAPPSKQPQTTRPSETAPAGGAMVDLKPKFRAGQVIKYVLDQTASNAVKSLDPNDTTLDQDQKQVQRIGLTMTVEQSGDEGATIKVVYDSIKIKLDTPDGTAEYDSTKPATKPSTKPATTPAPRSVNPNRSPSTTPAPVPGSTGDPLKDLADMDMNGSLGSIVGPMVGTTITVKTDRTGAVTSVSGGEALGGPMGGLGMGGGLGGAMVPNPTAVANWLVAGVGGPNNRGSARVGETWTNNDALSGTPVGSFSMKTTHTLRSASGGSANISFAGGIEPNTGGAAPAASIGQVQSATYTGNYIWDTRNGALAEMGTDMRVVLDAGFGGVKARMTSATQVKVRRQ